MAKAIRSSPYAIQRATAFARRVTRADVQRAYEAIYAADQVIKTGRAESDVAALTLCVLDLCGVANADLRDMLLVEAPRRQRFVAGASRAVSLGLGCRGL